MPNTTLEPKITTDDPTYVRCALDTACTALVVKKKNWTLNQFSPDFLNEITHGAISSPTVNFREVTNDNELYSLIRERAKQTGGLVRVIGLGLFRMPAEIFTWTGDVELFCETWRGD